MVEINSVSYCGCRYPHNKHGNASKPSNSAKSTIMEEFFHFINMNSQPNGRAAGPLGPTQYFLSKFTTIQAPKHGLWGTTKKVSCWIQSCSTRVQKGVCSNGSSHNWLKAHQLKVAICAHQEDYCDTCSHLKTEIQAKQTNTCLLQSSTVVSEEVKKVQHEKTNIQQTLQKHRKVTCTTLRYRHVPVKGMKTPSWRKSQLWAMKKRSK